MNLFLTINSIGSLNTRTFSQNTYFYSGILFIVYINSAKDRESMTMDSAVLHDISVVCEAFSSDRANDFLILGWKILAISNDYHYEDSPEFKKHEKIARFRYSLGWFGDRDTVKYP